MNRINDKDKLRTINENMISLVEELDKNNLVMLDIRNELVAMINYIQLK